MQSLSSTQTLKIKTAISHYFKSEDIDFIKIEPAIGQYDWYAVIVFDNTSCKVAGILKNDNEAVVTWWK